MRILPTIDDVEAITAEWVKEHVDHDRALAIRKDKQYWPSSDNAVAPWSFVMPQPGTFRRDSFGEYEVLVWIPTLDIRPSEGDWEFAIRHWSTQTYIKWARAGIAPPPIRVVRSMDGSLLSGNRRRWLAAREAGVEWLPCWYSPTHPVHCSRSAWWLPEYSEFYRERASWVMANGFDPLHYFKADVWERMTAEMEVALA